MKISTPVCMLILFFFFTNSFAQNNSTAIDSVNTIYQTLVKNSNKEKIILQSDRRIYMAGEKIWFKAFVLNAGNNKFNLSEKILFADFVDDHDKVIDKLVLNNSELNTNGAFNLPDTLNSGFYWLRLYTNKILANNIEDIYLQPVYVINKRKPDTENFTAANKVVIKNNNTAAPLINFYGERVTGIPGVTSTGVLQITDADNNALKTTGEIVNSNDSVITKFATNHFGLTRITFLNEVNQKYTAVFHINGHDIKYALPAVDNFAAQLSVAKQTENNIKAFVTLEDSLPADYSTVLLGMNGDSLCYASVGYGTYGINIPSNNFPGGISSLLLFDQHKNLLAERKIFVNKNNYSLDIKANKKNYRPRDNASLNIKITDANKDPLVAAINVSVQDAWLEQLSDSIEIDNLTQLNEFQLNNWLKLYSDKTSLADVDLLMFTIRSLYNPATNAELTSNINNDDDERLLNFTGKITDNKNKPLKDWIITAISKNQNEVFTDVDTTRENGVFKIPLPQNMDSLSLSLQVLDKHGVYRTDENIVVDSFDFPKFATPASLKQQFLAYNKKTVAFIHKYQVDTSITFQGIGWLTPVKVKTVEKKVLNYDESRRFTQISQILTSDKFSKGGPDAIGNALIMVPGVSYLNGDISIFGSGIHSNNTVGKPLVIMDGTPVTTGSVIGFINSLLPSEIDFIEVLRGAEAAFYGMRGGDGVILINSRRGPSPEILSKSYFAVYKPQTYHVSPTFNMPDYSNEAIKNSPTHDPRNTIYWNGNLVTNTEGQASVNFYTADNATNYTVTVTGLSAKGDIIYKRILISRN